MITQYQIHLHHNGVNRRRKKLLTLQRQADVLRTILESGDSEDRKFGAQNELAGMGDKIDRLTEGLEYHADWLRKHHAS